VEDSTHSGILLKTWDFRDACMMEGLFSSLYRKCTLLHLTVNLLEPNLVEDVKKWLFFVAVFYL
jgi:hypothetical protein